LGSAISTGPSSASSGWKDASPGRSAISIRPARTLLQRPADALRQKIWRISRRSIDLAEVQAARGRQAEAVRLVREVQPLLQSWGMHTEGLALWLLFQESLAAGRIRDDTFRRMAEYVRRAWFRPLAERDREGA